MLVNRCEQSDSAAYKCISILTNNSRAAYRVRDKQNLVAQGLLVLKREHVLPDCLPRCLLPLLLVRVEVHGAVLDIPLELGVPLVEERDGDDDEVGAIGQVPVRGVALKVL